ncbi:hypothetical protein DCC79_01500 [bacterium]|nr:hypothetical protein [Chloroflexi bacterium CFX6]RIL12398.1 MAG: hypothetical protein DCC79_01500 [bacterium]
MIPPPRLRRIKLSLALLAACMGGLGWLATRPAPVVDADAPRQRELPLSDVSPWGANFFLEQEVDAWNAEQTVAWAARAGIRWAKQHFPWYEIERGPGDFRWDKYDRIVDLYRANGIEVIARLDFPGAWVAAADWVPPEKRGPPANTPPEDYDDYGRFVKAVATHFKGRVRFYQIWNEPNLIYEWGYNPSHPVDPDDYTDMLRTAARAARQADPNAVILSAPLAINTETVEQAGNMSDLAFLRGMYEADAAAEFDILSVNAFGMDRPPEDAPAEDVLNFRRVELHRQVMVDASDACTPIWANEFGWNAAPAGMHSMWRQVTEAQQADFTVGGVRWAGAHWPWAGVFSIWFFRHPSLPRDDAVHHFRMLDADFNPRRVYAAVQAAAVPVVAGPGDWAERSEPVRLSGLDDWTWRWDGTPDQRSWSRLRCLSGACCRAPDDLAADFNFIASESPLASLSFRFRGPSIAVRLRSLSAVSVADTAVDGDQRTVTLREADGWQWHVVADGLSGGTHELRLAVGGAGGRIAIDGFRVGSGPPSDPRWSWLTGLAGLALVLAVLVAWDVRYVARRVEAVDEPIHMASPKL